MDEHSGRGRCILSTETRKWREFRVGKQEKVAERVEKVAEGGAGRAEREAVRK